MIPEHLFVYGTLRRDIRSEMYHLLARFGDFVGDATFQGQLYLMDYYPGVVPSTRSEDKVFGEVYRLADPTSVLSRLDAYEECGTRFPQPTEYVRRMERVCLQSGESIEAWIYIYNRSTTGLQRIESGDFLSLRT